MARLPQPGGDNGNWGDILNDYLSQTLKADGSIKDNSVTSNAIAPNAVTASEIATDAIGANQIADGSITNILIADGTIAEAKLASAVQAKLNATAGTPDWSTITNKPAVIGAGADQAAARTAIGAGTGSSNLAIGTTGTTAKAGNYQPTSTDISDATATGRSLLTATNAASAKTTLSLTKSDVGLANVDNTADTAKPVSTAQQTALDAKAALSHSHTSSQISDSSTVGRSVLAATDAASARTAIGAGTSNLAIGTTSTTAKAGDYSPTKADVGLGNVDNTSDVTKNAATATLTNKTLTNPAITNYTETVVALGTVTTANTLSLTNGTMQTATLTASTLCTFTMPTAVTGKSFTLLLKQALTTGNGTASFTGVKWSSSGVLAVTATAGKMDIVSFISDGTNWYGSYTQGYTP